MNVHLLYAALVLYGSRITAQKMRCKVYVKTAAELALSAAVGTGMMAKLVDSRGHAKEDNPN